MPKKEKIVAKTGKLLSRRGKDALGYSEASVYEPADFFEKQYGTLYFVIEVASPDPSAKEIGELIIENVKEEYYADLDRDILVSFETALKRVNEELADMAHDGKTGWINKLNAIIAVLHDNELHLTQAGATEAYLLRGEVLTNVSEGLYTPTKEPDPLKTFANISSGQLDVGDRVVVSTPGLFYSTSLDTIKKTIKDTTPAKSVAELAELLKDEKDALGTSLIVMEISNEEIVSSEVREEEPDEIWIEEPKNKLESLSDKAKPMLAGAKTSLVDLWTKTKKMTKGQPKIVPGPIPTPPQTDDTKIPEKGHEIENEAKDGIKKEEIDELEKTADKKGEPAKEEHIKVGHPKDMHFEKEHVPKGHAPETDAFSKPAHPLLAEKATVSHKGSSGKPLDDFKKTSGEFLKKAKAYLGDLWKDVRKGKPQRADKYLTITIAAFVIFAASIGILYYKNVQAKEYQRVDAIYKDALTKEQDAESALIYKDRNRAKILLDQSLALADQIKLTSTHGQKAQELIVKIKDQLDKASGIIRLANPTVFADLAGAEQNAKTSNLFSDGTNFYAINYENNAIYKYSTADKKATLAFKPTDVKGKIKSTCLNYDKTISIYTDAPAVYEYDPATNGVTDVSVSSGGSFKQGTEIATYKTYLYLLSPQDNQIYRYNRTLSGYSKGIDYLASGVDVKNSISMAISDFVYILNSDGKILELASGASTKFELKNMVGSFSKVSKIYAESGFENIYIVDSGSKSVFVFTAKGEYVGQFTSDKFNDVKGISVSEKNKKIYILSDNKIYEVDLSL